MSFAFAPSISETALYAFNMCQIRSTALTAEHMNSVPMAANMLFSRWSNQGVNLWEVKLATVNLVQGQGTYTAADSPTLPQTIMVLDAFVSTVSGGVTTDRSIIPISRTEYASYPNKSQQSFPTVFWFDRLISPTITIWPLPDGSGNPSTLSYYYVSQIADGALATGAAADIPYRWFDAFANGLAFNLAKLWAPEVAALLKGEADEAYQIAAMSDEENVNLYISPMLSGYFQQ